MYLEEKGVENVEFVFYLWGGSLILTLVLTVMMPIIALISYLVGR